LGKYGVLVRRIPYSQSEQSEESTCLRYSMTSQKYELLAFINDEEESHNHR
jgi:hypothetical protein